MVWMHWICCLFIHLLFEELLTHLHFLLHASCFCNLAKISFRKYVWYVDTCLLLVSWVNSVLFELPGLITIEIRGSLARRFHWCFLNFELYRARHCILFVVLFAIWDLLQLPTTAVCRPRNSRINWDKLARPWRRIMDGLNECLVVHLMQSLCLRKILRIPIFAEDSRSIRSVSVGSI